MTKNFEIVYRNPAELIPYEMNAKKHDEQQIRDLAAAIKKRGFDQPITVDKHDVIITGHGRREAALLAGLERVPVIVRDDLSEEEVKAKRLEDNRLASIDYDAIKLQQELESLVLGEVEVFGFEERELNVLVGSMSASGETRLYIDPKCKHLIDSLEKVIYKPGSRDMDKTGGIEHSADALGYPVHRRYPVKNRVILGGSR